MRTYSIALLFCAALFAGQCIAQTTAPEATVAANNSAMVHDFGELVSLLDRDSVAHQTNAAEKLVVIPTEKNGVDSVCVIRWASDVGFVHFIHQIPVKLSSERVSDVEIAMMRLNHGIPYPGLGINHDTQAVYFRMSIPYQPQGGLTPGQIRTYFSHTLSESEKWRPILADVISGKAPAKQIVKYFNSKQAGATPAARSSTSSSFPPKQLSCELSGSKWLIRFTSEKAVTLIRDGKVAVNSTYETENDRIRFSDLSGPLAADSPGVYQWKVDGSQVKFTKISDESEGRSGLLTTSAWTITQ